MIKRFLRKLIGALSEEDVRKIIWDIELRRLRGERQRAYERMKGTNL
jgi:hypothetical protein